MLRRVEAAVGEQRPVLHQVDFLLLQRFPRRVPRDSGIVQSLKFWGNQQPCFGKGTSHFKSLQVVLLEHPNGLPSSTIEFHNGIGVWLQVALGLLQPGWGR